MISLTQKNCRPQYPLLVELVSPSEGGKCTESSRVEPTLVEETKLPPAVMCDTYLAVWNPMDRN